VRTTPSVFGFGSWVVLGMCALSAGCSQPNGSHEIPDDEPMKRLKSENTRYGKAKDPKVAARDNFLPKYYFDPDHADKKGNPPNYLKGMDRVAVKPGAVDAPDNPLWLQTPVYQLMDKGGTEVPLFKIDDPINTPNEILGRNTWMLWCSGNEGFWDWLATDSLSFIDLLKVIDSRGRARRFETGGMINEPRMAQSGRPDEFGIWLDEPIDSKTRTWRDDYLKKTFSLIAEMKHESQRGLFPDHPNAGYETDPSKANRTKPDSYDSKKEAEAVDYPPPEIYGISSGVVGLRLFPNPNFTAEARKKWDARRYYEDPEYFNDPNIIRPYRVGMACAFCHASFHPLFPPRDVTNPSWENVSGNIGAQYLRVRAVFAGQLDPSNFIYHILDSQPPGTIDTSLIASDSINNPNTMNSVFNLPQRALMAFRNPREKLSDISAHQPSIWRNLGPTAGEDQVPAFYRALFSGQGMEEKLADSNGNPRFTPRVLLDGADSIGPWGALSRVYLNIGTYYEQWIRLHRPVVGFKTQGAFKIEDCQSHSLYWLANQDRVAALRDYFLNATPPMPLVAASVGEHTALQVQERGAAALDPDQPIGKTFKQEALRHIDRDKLAHGRKVFARNCIVCHSSIQPESSSVTVYESAGERKEYETRFAGLIEERIRSRDDGGTLGEFWEHDPAQWLQNQQYQSWAEEVVESESFWRLNYLSTDYRIPVTLVRTNSGRAMATNALDQNMWDDFTSESYQHLPSVGTIEFFNPYLGSEGGMDRYTPRHKVRNDAPAGGGGPGFYRVPTLVSIWSTAPLLHNNSLGTFTNDPSVKGRLDAFDDAIRKLLWPEKRLKSSSYNGATEQRLTEDHGLIWRTPQETFLHISGRRVPTLLGSEISSIMTLDTQFPWLKEIRPLWLPSGILMLTSFLLLFLGSELKRRRAGVLYLLAAAVGILLWMAPGKFGFLSGIYPLWLPSLLLFVGGLIFLAIDKPHLLQSVGLAGIIVAVLGLVLYLTGDRLPMPAKWNHSAPIGWLVVISALGGASLILTGFTKSWRAGAGGILLGVAGLGFVINILDANLRGSLLSGSLGPLWVYSLLLLAAALVVLTPDQRQLTRYVGYSALILSLTSGLVINFLAGRLGDIQIGPIPKGTPVNLLANLNPDADPQELADALKITVGALAEIQSRHLSPKDADKVMREKIAPALMKVNKCPDFVMDQGHAFEWFKDMTDHDKDCLIELLKTF